MTEPVTFAMVATALRLGGDTSEQTLIEGYIVAAREWVEDYSGHILVQREVTERFATFGDRLYLARRPAVEITAIAFVDSDGAARDYIGFDLRFDGRRSYAHPALAGWPVRYRAGSILVSYLAGYEPLEVPQRCIQAILLLAAEFYRKRSAGTVSLDAERAVASLLRSLRVRTL